jgi:AraC-like DNA-binding protein
MLILMHRIANIAVSRRRGMPEELILLHERSIESLSSIGFAVAHFPNYRHAGNAFQHGHDILELNFIVSGTARHRIGDMERECGAGTLGIVHYGQKHSLKTGETGADVINLYLDPANHALPSLPAEFSAVAGSLFPPAVLPGTPSGLCAFLQFKDHAHIAQLLSYCCEEQQSMKPGYEASLESALRIFLIACARQATVDGVETMAADSSRWRLLEGLRLKLDREFASPHRLADLATEAAISKAHLCRRFKSYTGLTPFAYLAQCRIRAAMQELRNSNRKVLDIAFSVGFNDIGHFNRKFRGLADCSPSQYRKQYCSSCSATA